MARELTVKLTDTIPGVGKAGQRVTLALQPADVHDPTEIPTYLAGYKPFGFRADEVSPAILKDKDEDKFRTFHKNNAFRRVDVKGSLGGAVPEVDPDSSLETYKVVDRYVGSFIPKVTRQQADYDVMMAASQRCNTALYLDRECDVWELLSTISIWDPAVHLALGAGENWDEGPNSHPVKAIQTAIQRSAQRVTSIWFNEKVSHAFLRNPETKDHMRQMLGDRGAENLIARATGEEQDSVDFRIPGLPPFKVSAGKVLNEVTDELDYILPDVALLVSQPPGVPQNGEAIATSYTFRRKGESGVGWEADEYFIQGRGPKGGTLLVASQADIAKMTGNIVGGIITGVHS